MATCKVDMQRQVYVQCFTDIVNPDIHCRDAQRQAEQMNRRSGVLGYNLRQPSLEFKAKVT